MTRLLKDLARASSGAMAVAQGAIVRIVMLVMNLGTGILSARILGPAGRAEQAALLLGVTILPTVLSFGIPLAVQYKLKTQPQESERLVSSATFLAVCLGIVTALASIFVLPRMLTQYSPHLIFVAQLFMIAAPFTSLMNVFNGILQARNRFAEANVSQYGPLLTALIVLSCLAIAQRLTPFTSALTYLFTGVGATCWLGFVVRPKLALNGFGGAARGLLNFGLRTYITDILGTLQLQIDTVLVIGLLSPESMGLYAIALSASRLSDLFSTGIVAVVFPKAVGLPLPEVLALTNRVARLTCGLIFLNMIFNIVTMPILLPAFFGAAYSGAVPVAQVLALTFILNGTGWVLSQAFLAAGKPIIIAVIQAAGLAFAIPMLVILIPRFGLMGAAWALVIATVLRTAVTMACFPIVLKAPIPSILLTGSDLRFVYEALRKRRPVVDGS